MLKSFQLSPSGPLTLSAFREVVYLSLPVQIGLESIDRLKETRSFIDDLLEKNIEVYGVTTGFADLRNMAVPPSKASELSYNLIVSHDAGIGHNLHPDIVLGAMVVRANSLGKGNSGFQPESLQTLVAMINAKIIPEIPCHGSLGASGDLALLARLGRAMMGEDVYVQVEGKRVLASVALKEAGIAPFQPKAKEGLALINGTSFMTSMCAIAVMKEVNLIENMFSLLSLFLNAVGAVDVAFCDSIQNARGQSGQSFVGHVLRSLIDGSPFIDRLGVQDDYCIRCLPQILGPKIELFMEHIKRVEKELEAVTDNPLIFKGEEISKDIALERIISFKDENWVVISGGNFHGEYLTSVADSITCLNAKIALLLERHMTYLLNPFRNKSKLPAYLIHAAEKGLCSGYMITQYTGNDLAQKIAHLGNPVGVYNLTSANESEDVVSYGSTACQRLLSQIELFEDFLAIYLTVVMQAYAIRRINVNSSPHLISEKIFEAIERNTGLSFPTSQEESFAKRYQEAKKLLFSGCLGEVIGSPLKNELGIYHDRNVNKNESLSSIFSADFQTK
jgi:histidine ammonia-lyase